MGKGISGKLLPRTILHVVEVVELGRRDQRAKLATPLQTSNYCQRRLLSLLETHLFNPKVTTWEQLLQPSLVHNTSSLINNTALLVCKTTNPKEFSHVSNVRLTVYDQQIVFPPTQQTATRLHQTNEPTSTKLRRELTWSRELNSNRPKPRESFSTTGNPQQQHWRRKQRKEIQKQNKTTRLGESARSFVRRLTGKTSDGERRRRDGRGIKNGLRWS